MRVDHSTSSVDTFGLRAGDGELLISVPPPVVDEVRSTFRDQLAAVGPDADRLVVTAVGNQFTVTVNGMLWWPGPDQTLVDQLVYVILRRTLDTHPERLHLHAAAVAWKGSGVLIAGHPGSGKSTLVVDLVRSGFDYATDERVGVDDDLRLEPCTRPISIPAGSFPLFPELDPGRTGAGSASPRFWHVPASQVRPGSGRAMCAATTLVFVRYDPSVTAELTAVHPAEATRLLLGDSPDASRFGARSVPLAARLCASLQCRRLVFGDTGSAAAAIAAAVAAGAPPRPVDVAELPPAGQLSPGAPRWSPGVTGVVVGERCVLHRERGGEVIELDEALSVWFRLFDGSANVDQVVREVAEANDMAVEQVTPLAVAALRRLRDSELVT